MGDVTKIAWCDHTFQPWIGCVRVSPGCSNCYAEALAKARFEGPPGKKLPLWGVDAARRPMSEDYWRAPNGWQRKAERVRARRRVFCASLADVFEISNGRNLTARDVMSDARMRLRSLILSTRSALDWLLLTKRPENIERIWPDWSRNGFPDNVWLGVTAEDQERADARIPILLAQRASVHFVSHEPALEAVDFSAFLSERKPFHTLDWIITGGESGPKARPYDLSWARAVIEQCRTFGRAPFVKQLGTRPFVTPKVEGALPSFMAAAPVPIKLAHSKGERPEEWPEDLRVREFPMARTA